MSCNRCDMTSKQLNPCADCLANIETYKAMRADHGISPAQLRERVEALELRVTALTGINNVQEQRIDAALKRIEELENQLAQLIPFDRLDEQALERKP